jgi:glucokinase
VHLGIDIGGTKTDVVVTTTSGEVLHRHRTLTGQGADAVVATTLAAIDKVCADAGLDPRSAQSIGVGIPGAIRDGEVRHAVNLGIERLDLAGVLREAWGVTPAVDNDVNCAAVGAWILAGDGRLSLAYLNLGTGLAAGIIVNGKVWRGARGAAGEIGHISVDPYGPQDGDGLRGNLETYASGSGILRQWGTPGSSVTDILAAAQTNPVAAEIRDRLYMGVAASVRMLVLTLDVEEVVIGGGLAGIGQPLLEGTREILNEWASHSAFLRSVQLEQRVRVLDTDQPVAAIGAAMRGAGHG